MFSARQLLLPETDFIRLSFITSAIYAFACVLTGVMWWEWVITGGGNANFVFGVRFECISLDPCFAHRETRLQLCHISRQLVSNPIPDRSCRFVYTPGHFAGTPPRLLTPVCRHVLLQTLLAHRRWLRNCKKSKTITEKKEHAD
jgi:hypothetical protein